MAALFVIVCVAHVITAPQPYPEGLPKLWRLAGLPILALSAGVATLRLEFIQEFPARALRGLMRPPPLVFGLAVGMTALLLSLGFAYYIFDHAPSTADEIAQLWHAKILLTGRLSLPPDPNPEFFAIDNMIDQGRWYSEYPIGGPLMLAPGVALGLPWIINPIFCGGTAVALYAFARQAFSEPEARAMSALFCVMPMVLFMSGSHMNHVPVLFLATCALAALAAWDRAETRRRAWIAAAAIGFSIGAMATIRPLDALVVAMCAGAFQVATVRRSPVLLASLAVQALAALIAVLPLMYANAATTGSPLRFGYGVLYGAQHQLGFHMDPTGTAHTIGRAVAYALSYVSALNLFATMWPVPTLLLAVAGLLSFRRVTRWDALLFGLFWCQVVAYAMYWHNGQFIGPRFLYTALPAVVMLLARAPFLIGDRFGAYWRRTSLVFVMLCIAFAWTFTETPFTVWTLARSIHESRRTVKADIAAAIHNANLHNALVFVREPFTARMLHRLWAVGMSRSESAALLATSDACSLFDAVRAAERDSLLPPEARLSEVRRNTRVYVSSDSSVRARDPAVRISSRSSVSAPCLAELADGERYGGGAFGPALLHEPIDADGHIAGDVVFVADLGERNERLRARFGNRQWYRLSVLQRGELLPAPVIEPY